MLIAEAGFPHDRSWFKKIRRLPTGECLTAYADKGAPVLSVFDEFGSGNTPPETVDCAADQLRRLLAKACRRVLNGAESTVVLLSGGIDSAVIAYEAAQHCRETIGRHFTLDSFPGFEYDKDAAHRVARACGIPLVIHEMSNYTKVGGNYLMVEQAGALPATHAPVPGLPGAVEHAESAGASAVLTGLLTGEVFMDDSQLNLLNSLRWSVLNPLETGEPIWHTLSQLAGYSSARDKRGLLQSLITGEPSIALPQSYMFYRRTGLTKDSAERVEDGLRKTALRVYQSTGSSYGTGRRSHLSQVAYRRLIAHESLNVPHLHASWLNHFIPHRQILGLPFADRDVVEMVLALPPQHRFAVGFGVRSDKFVLRMAYTGKPIPHDIADRRHQAEIDAVPALFVINNFDKVRRLIGKRSALHDLGVISDSFISSMSPQNAHKAGDTIARMCRIEQWLRTMA
jgi:hypothetical protein